MFDNIKTKNLLFGLAVIPSVIMSSGIGSYAYSQQFDNQPAKIQNTIAFRLSSLWQRQPKKPKVVRGGDICPISPGLVDTYFVWHNRPLFLWKNRAEQKEAVLIVRDRINKELAWKQAVKTADEKLLYNGTNPLVAGKSYEWKLSGTDDEWKTFQIMSTEEQTKIAAELQQIEQKLKASKTSAEDIALEKAEYFSNRQVEHKTEKQSFDLWSDIFQTLYEVDKPSPEFAEKRQEFLLKSSCKSERT